MNGNNGKNSVFDWSPLPSRKYLTRKHHNSDPTDGKEETVFYPNSDNLLWLRSCDKEVIEPINGEVRGTIPDWLNGVLFRNGPGSLRVGDHAYDHLFDCAALLHRFQIKDGAVTYQCRFLQSDVYKAHMAGQRIVFTEFGTKSVPDPCQTIFQKISLKFNVKSNISDNAMVSVYPFGDELYAFTECPAIHKVNKSTLATEAKVHIDDHVAIVNHTAHPHVVADGTVYNLAMSAGLKGPAHNIICFPNRTTENSCEESSCFTEAYFAATLPARWRLHPSYMHSFGITDNYFVIVEQPLSLSVLDLAKCKYYNDPIIGSFNWFPEEKAKINILCRKTGKLLHYFLADTFFYLHIINQYEIGDYVIIDLCCYRDPATLECMYIDVLKNLHKNPDYAKMFRARPLRFVLPLKITTQTLMASDLNLITLPNCKAEAYMKENGEIFVVPERLCDLGCEVPRINYEKHLGKFYQYFYAVSADVDTENPGTLIKVNVATKETTTWCENNCFPSEPIFVPTPNSKVEDDGILLTVLLWRAGQDKRVGLLILDARTMQEVGRSEFKTPGVTPRSVHGWFLPNTH